MQDFERRISAAQGYSELGMPREALTELDGLDARTRDRPEILEMRLLILVQEKRWKPALAAGRRLCKAAPENGAGFIHVAFCLHELGRTDEAKTTLLAGPASLMDEPTYHYNLACYECALGNLESAQAHLETSFGMDAKFRDFAQADPDLLPLRGGREGF